MCISTPSKCDKNHCFKMVNKQTLKDHFTNLILKLTAWFGLNIIKETLK